MASQDHHSHFQRAFSCHRTCNYILTFLISPVPLFHLWFTPDCLCSDHWPASVAQVAARAETGVVSSSMVLPSAWPVYHECNYIVRWTSPGGAKYFVTAEWTEAVRFNVFLIRRDIVVGWLVDWLTDSNSEELIHTWGNLTVGWLVGCWLVTWMTDPFMHSFAYNPVII